MSDRKFKGSCMGCGALIPGGLNCSCGDERSKPRTVGTYAPHYQGSHLNWNMEGEAMLFANLEREKPPSRTEVEWRKLPARYRGTVDPDDV
jgi:hypothetical protein